MPLAEWIGPFDAFCADFTTLRPGDTREVTEDDLLSGHWRAVEPEPSKPTIASFTPLSTPTSEATD